MLAEVLGPRASSFLSKGGIVLSIGGLNVPLDAGSDPRVLGSGELTSLGGGEEDIVELERRNALISAVGLQRSDCCLL